MVMLDPRAAAARCHRTSSAPRRTCRTGGHLVLLVALLGCDGGAATIDEAEYQRGLADGLAEIDALKARLEAVEAADEALGGAVDALEAADEDHGGRLDALEAAGVGLTEDDLDTWAEAQGYPTSADLDAVAGRVSAIETDHVTVDDLEAYAADLEAYAADLDACVSDAELASTLSNYVYSRETDEVLVAALVRVGEPCNVTHERGDWIQSSLRTDTGTCTITYKPGVFDGVPACVVAVGSAGNRTLVVSPGPSTLTLEVWVEYDFKRADGDGVWLLCTGTRA